MLAETVAVEDEPEDDDDDGGPHCLDRDLRPPKRRVLRSADPTHDELPTARLVGTPQGIGPAAPNDRRHARPEELGTERGDELRYSDPGDQHAVEIADQEPRKERGDDGK